MTEREKVIRECMAALSAACLGRDYEAVYDSSGCPTCGSDSVNGLRMEDITKVLEKLITNPIVKES